MAEPFVFHFSPGPDGHPHRMYIVDLRCACGLCQHPQLQRFYHACPLHGFTLRDLEALADQAHLKAAYDCENCGSPVGPTHVEQLVLHFGFADDAGILRIFRDRQGPNAPRQRCQLIPFRRLDPQTQPRFAPTLEDGPLVDQLDDELIEQHLGRPLEIKQAIALLTLDWLEDPDGAWTQLGPDCWCLLDASEEDCATLAEEITAESTSTDLPLVLLPLDDFCPGQLATHDNPAQMPGHLRSWMPPALLERASSGQAALCLLLDPGPAAQMVERSLRQARLDFHRDDRDDDILWQQLTTPRGETYPRALSLRSILQRAAYTGLSPGEAARLTVEEITGLLMDVWKHADEP